MEVLFFLLLLGSASGLKERFVVTGSPHPVQSSAGEEVILNCSIDTHLPIHQLEEVSWTKHPDILVLLFQENKTVPDSSHQRYHGRVEFFSSELSRGNFSLRLKDVRLEDTGEYTCTAHGADNSAHTTVLIQQIGFSSKQKFILVLCFFSSVLALGLGVPVFVFLQKGDQTRRVLVLYILQVLCPNICMFIAFVLWSGEGFLSEITICAAVCVTRCLMLIKTSPYLNSLPEWLVKEVKTLGFPLSYFIIAVCVCSVQFLLIKNPESWLGTALQITGMMSACAFAVISARFKHRMQSFLWLGLCTDGLIFIGEDLEPAEISFVMNALVMVMLLTLSLQVHFFQQKPFKSLYIVVTSAIVHATCLGNIVAFIFISFVLRTFDEAWGLVLESVVFIVVWIALICVVRHQKCSRRWRGLGYVCCAALMSILMLASAILTMYYLIKYNGDTRLIIVTGFLLILTTLPLFKHPRKTQRIPHMIIYMFGASGLVLVTSITLAANMFLKSGTDIGTMPEMHIIILPFEGLFVSGWLVLQIWCSWMRMRERIKNNFEEMETLES